MHQFLSVNRARMKENKKKKKTTANEEKQDIQRNAQKTNYNLKLNKTVPDCILLF